MKRSVFSKLVLVWGAFAVSAMMGATSCETSGRNVELTIFHTNDLHSHLRASKADEYGLGGMARLATLLSQLRVGRQHSVTLDAGDWSEGAWPFSIDTGANMLRIMDQLHYDGIVVGNHDYLTGPDRMTETVREAAPRFAVLASNLDLGKYAGAERLRKYIGATHIIERNGIKIGLIGLTCTDFEFQSFLKPVKTTNVFTDTLAKAKELRPKVDVLIVISHNKFDVNSEIAKNIPGVDAVVSGHSHHKVARAVLVKNAGKDVPVVETGSWGRFLGDLKLNINLDTKKVSYKAYQLHPVSPDLEEAPAIKAMIDAEYEKLHQLYGSDITEEVAHADIHLDGSDAHSPGLGQLATKGYRMAAKTDLALEIMGFMGLPIAKGPVTVEELHDVLPHTMDLKTGKEWTIKVWNAKATDLAMIANVFYSAGSSIPFGLSGFIATDNFEVTWAPKAPGNPVATIKSIRVGGFPLDLSKRYTVALTDGVLLSLTIADELFKIGLDFSQVYDTGIEGWRAILNYGKTIRVLNTETLMKNAWARTTTADLSLTRSDIQYSAGKIRARVSNVGLQRSRAGLQLKCSSGSQNQPVLYDTEHDVFLPIGESQIPALDPGKDVVLELPWNPQNGAWPVKCELAVGTPGVDDGYAANNLATTVLHL